MASLISCPHCGTRPKEEFAIRGDATPVRPAPLAADEVWHDYVHLRANRELIARPGRIYPGQVFELPLVYDD